MHAPISPQCSKWAKDDSRTADELEKNLEEFMTQLCKRYNGRKAIRWLDVVNETIDNKGGWFGPKPGTSNWENPWPKIGYEKNVPSQYKLLSKEGVPLYIIQAFEIATKHAPDVKFIINQHALIERAPAQKMKELVMYLRGRGFRVDGIGWQAHLSRDWRGWAKKDCPNLKRLEGLIAWAHKNDLEFHVTENNIHVLKTSPYDTNTVALVFSNIVRTLVAHSDTGVVTWNLWDIADKPHYKDQRKMKLGLWDKDFNPQEAYYAVQ
jgi:endo-1,4-beta-xylanase